MLLLGIFSHEHRSHSLLAISDQIQVVRSLGQAGSALPDREQDAELLRAVIPEVREARCMWFDLGMH